MCVCIWVRVTEVARQNLNLKTELELELFSLLFFRNQKSQMADIFARNFVGSPEYGDAVLDLFDDGGTVEFVPLISHVMRGVKSIFVGDWSSTPIRNSNAGDPAFCEITPYFGVMQGDCTKYSASASARPRPGILGDYTHNHIFEQYGLQNLLDQLWANAKAHRPTIVHTTLTTVENARYSIPAGQKHYVIWAFLSPSESFIHALPEATKNGIKKNKWGKFEGFPHYSTVDQNPGGMMTDINYSPEQVCVCVCV